MSRPFEKGNQLWQLRELNKPTKFEDDSQLAQACRDYFDWVMENPVEDGDKNKRVRPFTIGGLCLFIGISDTTWRTYRKDEKFKDLCEIVDAVIYENKFVGAAVNMFNANIISRDLGLADKSEVDAKVEVSHEEWLDNLK